MKEKVLSKERQLIILKAVKSINEKNIMSGFCDSFFLCTELKIALKYNGFDWVSDDELSQLFPIFNRENAKLFTSIDYSSVWFRNDIERHAFLDWMIEQLEAELKQENE
jgi:hypothetical protein